jgi:RTX calcium-binding nonapeptide repeat (4 copies)/WD40-like Beta Propeller Repeat
MRLTGRCDGVPTVSAAVALLLLLVPLSGHGNDLVVQHLDGSGRISLTGGTGFVLAEPAWSPDGSRVAFAANHGSIGTAPSHIAVVNADGSDLRALTPDLSVSDPVWSGDGTQIAFLNSSPVSGDVWTVPASGGTPRRLTTDGGDKAGLSWSPDGSTILYLGDASGTASIDALDPVTGAVRILAGTGFNNGPAGVWSPDGSRIAYTDTEGRLAVMSADGTDSSPLDAQTLVSAPSWSPDGSTIAYAVRRVLPGPVGRDGPPFDYDVWTVDVATGRSRRLTGAFDAATLSPPSVSPSWWPDGARLFFQSSRGPRTPPWEMNADGTCEQPVASMADFAAPHSPLWQPGAVFTIGPIECADLRVRVVSRSAQIALGASASASVVIENDGNLAATGVHVRLTSTNGGKLALSSCSASDCALGTIEPGGTRSLVATFGGQHKPMSINALITASSAEPDPTAADATGVASTQMVNCTIAGTPGPDVLNGTPGRDRICGFPGADRINGGKGDDYIDAGNGNDTIIGGPGRDTIIARGGRDVVHARDGQRDWIDCGTEYDVAVVDRIDHVRHCEKVMRR